MSLKARLLTSIAAVCLIVCLMIVGVLASENPSITMNGSLSFDAKDVVCRVEGNVAGAQSAITFNTLNYSSKTEPTEQQLASWNRNINFKNTADDIVITITITNLAEKSMKIIITDLIGHDTDTSNIIRSITKRQTGDSADSQYTSGSLITLPVSQTDGDSVVTFTIRLQVDNKGLDANVSYKYQIGLYDISVADPSGN